MSPDPNSAIRAKAIAWHISLRHGRAQDWDDFAQWLGRNSRHSPAYDAVALDDAALDRTLVGWSREAPGGTNDIATISRPSF